MDMKLSNWDLSYNNLYMHKKQYIYEKCLNTFEHFMMKYRDSEKQACHSSYY